jgi:hypothetical protein
MDLQGYHKSKDFGLNTDEELMRNAEGRTQKFKAR